MAITLSILNGFSKWRYGEKYYMCFVGNLLLFPGVKDFWKFITNNEKLSPWVWCTTFFGTQCVYRGHPCILWDQDEATRNNNDDDDDDDDDWSDDSPMTERRAVPTSGGSPPAGVTWHWNSASSDICADSMTRWCSPRLTLPSMRYLGNPGISRLNPANQTDRPNTSNCKKLYFNFQLN